MNEDKRKNKLVNEEPKEDSPAKKKPVVWESTGQRFPDSKRNQRLRVLFAYLSNDLPLSYCFRRWLFEMIMPKHLTVAQSCYVPGEEYYILEDLDMCRVSWGHKISVDDRVFSPLPPESVQAIINYPSQKTCSDTHQQSD